MINRKLIVAFSFIWCGLVIGISFMEAWLKFLAPGVTLAIGLGIGRIVFAALNEVEWVIACIIIICTIKNKYRIISRQNLFMALPVFILFIQSVWLLPVLNERATMKIENISMPPSNLHFYFVAAEVLKVISLIISGFLFLDTQT